MSSFGISPKIGDSVEMVFARGTIHGSIQSVHHEHDSFIGHTAWTIRFDNTSYKEDATPVKVNVDDVVSAVSDLVRRMLT